MTREPIEHRILEDFRQTKPLPKRVLPDDENLLRVHLHLALLVGRMIRSQSHLQENRRYTFKPDGSVVTDTDTRVEAFVKTALGDAFPDFGFIGEETGATHDPQMPTHAVDPIDGSWAFVAGDPTHAYSISLFQDKTVRFALVLNPMTGDLAYALGDRPTRRISLSVFGEDDGFNDLPMPVYETEPRIRVNLQPSKGHQHLAPQLRKAWQTRQIHFLKSPGGSPALGLLEAARGHYIYVHPWQSWPATPYDLAAGVRLVQNAGGRVTDLDGQDIQPIGHQGVFVAGVDTRTTETIRKLLKRG